MSPDKRRRPSRAASRESVRRGPSVDDAHDIAYYKRHPDDDPSERAPGREFIRSCPLRVRAQLNAVLVAVASAPPKRFAGGGYWEAMKGAMTGWFEVRVDGPARQHFRLFCLLDYEAEGVSRPLLTVIDGRDKKFRTVLATKDYDEIRALGDEYHARNPRSIC